MNRPVFDLSKFPFPLPPAVLQTPRACLFCLGRSLQRGGRLEGFHPTFVVLRMLSLLVTPGPCAKAHPGIWRVSVGKNQFCY